MKKIMILLMLVIIQCVDAKVMKKMRDVENVLSRPAIMPAPVPVPAVDQDAIKKRLDEQLRFPVTTAWDERINDLFDLAMVNRELARDYFIKMREKMAVVEAEKPEVGKLEEIKPVEEKAAEPSLPAGEEPMKKATGKPAPPRKPGMPKVESTETSKTETTEGVAAGEEMKKGTKPAPSRKPGAPSGGPAKKIGGAKTEVAKPGTTKEVVPKVTEQIFSVSKLQQLDNDKLLELFNDLLEKLGTVLSNWNGQAVEKVEEKTKYGSKIYNVHGAPISDWTHKIDTLKKVLISKNIMSETEVTKKINDRIAQVRAEKTIKPVVPTQPEEKPKEELTEDDLVKLITTQLADPKPTEIGWAIAIKGNIKMLDKLNHTTAMQYHDQFIKLTKEKPFLK